MKSHLHVPLTIQENDTDAGYQCVKMVASHAGSPLTELELRSVTQPLCRPQDGVLESFGMTSALASIFPNGVTILLSDRFDSLINQQKNIAPLSLHSRNLLDTLLAKDNVFLSEWVRFEEVEAWDDQNGRLRVSESLAAPTATEVTRFPDPWRTLWSLVMDYGRPAIVPVDYQKIDPSGSRLHNLVVTEVCEISARVNNPGPTPLAPEDQVLPVEGFMRAWSLADCDLIVCFPERHTFLQFGIHILDALLNSHRGAYVSWTSNYFWSSIVKFFKNDDKAYALLRESADLHATGSPTRKILEEVLERLSTRTAFYELQKHFQRCCDDTRKAIGVPTARRLEVIGTAAPSLELLVEAMKRCLYGAGATHGRKLSNLGFTSLEKIVLELSPHLFDDEAKAKASENLKQV